MLRNVAPRSILSYRFGSGARNEDGERIPYHGPSDGRSRPNLAIQKLVKPLVGAVVRSNYKIEVEGSENIPNAEEGPVVFAPTHPSIFDPALMALSVDGDVRYMADIGLFQNKIAADFVTLGGAFPVDRTNPSPVSINHAVDVLKEGKSLCVFPEGGIGETHLYGRIGKFKKGAAFAALHGGANSVVPVAIHYQKETRPRAAARAAASALSLGLMAATTVSAGLPAVVAGACAVVSGAVFAGQALGKAAREDTDCKWYNVAPKVSAGLVNGAKGAAVGGLAAAAVVRLGSAMLPAPLSLVLNAGVGLAGGVGLSKVLNAVIDRDRARIKFGEPIAVEPFREKEDPTLALTVEMHQKIGELKSDLSGVPHKSEERPILKGFLKHSARPSEHALGLADKLLGGSSAYRVR